jgi:trk system potassium uptake protein TrkA
MKLIVVGCGRMGAELAYHLYQQQHQVVVIDQELHAFENLHPNFRGRTIEGDALAEGILHRAGIEEADGLAAVTNSDVVNAVVGHIAHRVYHLPKVVTRNYDARWLSLLETFELTVVSSMIWGAQQIETLLYSKESQVVFSAGHGEVNLYELAIPVSCHNYNLQKTEAGDEFCLVSLTRNGEAMLPSPPLTLNAGDVLHVSATPAGIAALRTRLGLKEG